MEQNIKNPLWVAYLLIVATTSLFMWLWMPLMFYNGSVGFDWGPSLVITGLYLLVLKKTLSSECGNAFIGTAIGAFLVGPLSLFVRQGDALSHFSSLTSTLIQTALAFLPGILIVSGLSLAILVKFIYKRKPKKGLYYPLAALVGAGLAIVYFLLIIIEMEIVMLIRMFPFSGE